MGNVDDIYL